MLSIIIPVYNVENFLRDCLNSVTTQSVTDFEIICINDGSTDSSLSVLNNYSLIDNRIKIINQENKGLSAARNAGIRAAKGEYVFFLDSDDWLEPDALKILVENQSGEDIICFNGRRYFENGTEEYPDKGIEENNLTGWEYYNKYALVSRNFHFVCAVLRIYRREFLLRNSLFFTEGIYHEDNLFTPIACYYAKSVKIIPNTLYVYRIREGSITQTSNKKRIYDIVEVANSLASFFIPKTNLKKDVIFREIAGEYFKGFMPDEIKKYGKNDKELVERIQWESFKVVSTYPRHKRIFWLLKINPFLLRLYLNFERYIKFFF